MHRESHTHAHRDTIETLWQKLHHMGEQALKSKPDSMCVWLVDPAHVPAAWFWRSQSQANIRGAFISSLTTIRIKFLAENSVKVTHTTLFICGIMKSTVGLLNKATVSGSLIHKNQGFFTYQPKYVNHYIMELHFVGLMKVHDL